MKNNPYNDFFRYRKKLSGHLDEVNALEISPSGSFFASGDILGCICLTDCLNFQKEKFETPNLNNITSLCFKDEFNLVTTSEEGHTCVFDLYKNTCIRKYVSTNLQCTKVSINKNNSKLLENNTKNLMCVSNEKGQYFYDLRECGYKPVQKFFHGYCSHPKMAFVPNSSSECFVATDGNWKVEMYDYRNFKHPIFRYKTKHFQYGFDDVCFNEKGNFLLLSLSNDTPVMYDVNKISPVMKFICMHGKNYATAKQFRFGGKDDEYILGGFDNKKLCYWKIRYDGEWQDKLSENINILCNEPFIFERNLDTELKKFYKKQEVFTYSLSKVITPKYNKSELVEFNNLVSNQENSRKFSYVHLYNQKYRKNSMYMQLNGFKSVVNTVAMHPKIPRIFAAGTESTIYAFSPFDLGEDEENVFINKEAVESMNRYADDAERSFYECNDLYVI
ncbi:hypothetical protein EHP00_1334 [Ecytonucleospora hepatopenaei]|uniref:Uncharacterized protein n=1 Tax=Ecytonucleospora hepatopenaei TaxID=646526 RepID=A0A1W0E728_9MICR|nr:hypothetical protein EHP00_1334 [Ecytonucleospora hepatopenaei]